MFFINNDQSIDKEKDLIAFIDEAGDEGFSEASAKWFVVGGAFFQYKEYQKASSNLEDFANNKKLSPKKIHFRKLPHNKRKDLCSYLNEAHYNTIFSAFSKRDFSDVEKALCTYPNMYFVGIKNVIERGTWLCSQLGCSKVHFAIASRNRVILDKLDKYLFNSHEAGKFLLYENKLGKVVIANEEHMGIKCADIVASSMWQALEPTGRADRGEYAYFDICINDRERLYKSTNPKYKGIWNNGFRCTPRKKELIESIGRGILTEE